MPLYEYACQDCSHTFEALVFDGEAVECPQCEGEKLERLLSLPGRPKTSGSTLPTTCNPDLPPCSPHCCRL